MAHVILLVGVPGSGKSTWARQKADELAADGHTVCHISRDEVRFSLLNDDDSYFEKEKQVFSKFMWMVNDAIHRGMDYVLVDATHITPQSRNKVLSRLRPATPVELTIKVFDTPQEVCFKRNSERGGRTRVPDAAIHKMAQDFTRPTQEELLPLVKTHKFSRINVEVIKSD